LDVVKSDLGNVPGIASVAAWNGNYNGTVAKVDGNEIGFGYIGVDDDFLSTLTNSDRERSQLLENFSV
jgi:putative ABC transport system permease protein